MKTHLTVQRSWSHDASSAGLSLINQTLVAAAEKKRQNFIAQISGADLHFAWNRAKVQTGLQMQGIIVT